MGLSPSIFGRAAGVMLAGLLLAWVPPPDQATAFRCAAFLSSLLLLGLFAVPRYSHLPATLVIVPVALVLSAERLRLPEVPPVSSEFLSFVRPTEAVDGKSYERALDARATIMETDRGTHIAELRLESERRRPKRAHAASTRNAKGQGATWRSTQPRGRWRERGSERERGGVFVRRTERGFRRARFHNAGMVPRGTAAGGFRSSSSTVRGETRPSRPRMGTRKRRAASVTRMPDARPFIDRFTVRHRDLSAAGSVRMALSVGRTRLRPGCVLDLRLYGRGLPTSVAPRAAERLAARGVFFQARVSVTHHVRGVRCPDPSLRERLLERVRALLATGPFVGPHGDALRGMLLGNARELRFEDRNRLSELGVIHLFAASGLHMMLFYASLMSVARLLLGAGHPLAVLAPLPLCFAYLWLLDFPISLARAFLFVLLHSVAKATGRSSLSMDVFWAAVLLLLAWTPRGLFSLSGILSCSAVGAILHGAAPLTRLLESCRCGRAAGSLAVGVAALAGTAPILMYVFGGHSFGAIVANAYLVPAAGVVLPLALAYAGIGLLPGLDSVAAWAAWPVAWTGRIFFEAATLSAPLGLYSRPGSGAFVVLAGVGLVFLAVRLQNSETAVSQSGRRLALAGIALLGPGGACVVDVVRFLAELSP